MSNNLLNLLAGLGTTAILFLILVPLIIDIVILVWLHNISLNTYRIYTILEDMYSEKLDDSSEAIDENLQILPLKGVFIGGSPQLFSKLRQYLPNFTFVSKDATSFDEKLLINKDIVVLYSVEMNSKLKAFTIDLLEENHIKNRLVIGRVGTVQDIIAKIAEKTE